MERCPVKIVLSYYVITQECSAHKPRNSRIQYRTRDKNVTVSSAHIGDVRRVGKHCQAVGNAVKFGSSGGQRVKDSTLARPAVNEHDIPRGMLRKDITNSVFVNAYAPYYRDRVMRRINAESLFQQSFQDYLPKEAKKIDDAVILQSGKYIVACVSGDKDMAGSVIREQLKGKK